MRDRLIHTARTTTICILLQPPLPLFDPGAGESLIDDQFGGYSIGFNALKLSRNLGSMVSVKDDDGKQCKKLTAFISMFVIYANGPDITVGSVPL